MIQLDIRRTKKSDSDSQCC